MMTSLDTLETSINPQNYKFTDPTTQLQRYTHIKMY